MGILKLTSIRRVKLPRVVSVYTDGAIRPAHSASGLSAIVYDLAGNALYWHSWQVGKLTCNEAEYQAVITALEDLLPLGPVEVDVYTDSQILVQQMQGLATAQAYGLRQAYAQLRG